MPVSEQASGKRLVLSLREPLIAGGAAEEFEQRVRALFREGFRHLVADVSAVSEIDSAGVRALVRGHTTAQRVGGSFRLAGVTPRVREVIHLAHLEGVLDTYESISAATARHVPWSDVGIALAAALLGAALVGVGMLMPDGRFATGASGLENASASTQSPGAFHPFTGLIELIAATLIGVVVTAVHKRQKRDRPMSRSMEQAQVLLCVSGALMMIIIGNSVARAFGIAGAAGIIRFRTPVEDPKDVTILFLLMGLGMAAGMGALPVAGLGTVFLCAALVVLDRVVAAKPRMMAVEITASGRDFPFTHVIGVFASHGIAVEPREVSQGDEAIITYTASLPPGTSIEDVSSSLVGDVNAGVKSVTWEAQKKG